MTPNNTKLVERLTRECPECGGAGFIEVLCMECCQGSDWECGGVGCTGPHEHQEQELCDICRGEGRVEA